MFVLLLKLIFHRKQGSFGKTRRLRSLYVDVHILLLFPSQNIKVRIPTRALFFKVYCSITLSHLLDISEMTRFVLFLLQRHINLLPVSRANTEYCSIIAVGGCKSNPGWESLQSRRNTHKLLLFCKKVHGNSPN